MLVEGDEIGQRRKEKLREGNRLAAWRQVRLGADPISLVLDHDLPSGHAGSCGFNHCLHFWTAKNCAIHSSSWDLAGQNYDAVGSRVLTFWLLDDGE